MTCNSGNGNAVNLMLGTSYAGPGIGTVTSGNSTRKTVTWDISSYAGSYFVGISSWVDPGDDISVYVHQVWLE